LAACRLSYPGFLKNIRNSFKWNLAYTENKHECEECVEKQMLEVLAGKKLKTGRITDCKTSVYTECRRITKRGSEIQGGF
jgi:hypothetical protein